MKKYICSTNKSYRNVTPITVDNIGTIKVGDSVLWVINDFDCVVEQKLTGIITHTYPDHALATFYDEYGRPMERVWVDVGSESDMMYLLH